MIPVKHIDPDDIALYAMQLLPPDETEEMTLHLQHSAEARRVLSGSLRIRRICTARRRWLGSG